MPAGSREAKPHAGPFTVGHAHKYECTLCALETDSAMSRGTGGLAIGSPNRALPLGLRMGWSRPRRLGAVRALACPPLGDSRVSRNARAAVSTADHALR
jgi:hypothetical protein